jgi:N,N'-diacetyllegionaminate synthase
MGPSEPITLIGINCGCCKLTFLKLNILKMTAPYLIAEVGMAHDGSLGTAHAYIDALAQTGVNAVKFQVHIAEAESSLLEEFRVKFSYQDQNRMQYWQRTAFTKDQWQTLKLHCEDLKMEFLATPFSKSAVDLLTAIGTKRFKVSSGDVNNLLLLKHLSATGKEIILSSGMSSLDELDESITLLAMQNTKVSLMQCTTAYPTLPEQWGLNVIELFKHRYSIPVGFSDHSGEIFACLAATTMGADLLEFHVVFDKHAFGPDTNASIEINKIPLLVDGVQKIYRARNSPLSKREGNSFAGMKRLFEKSLAINRALPKGHQISFEDLESKKTGGVGVLARHYEKIIGKKLTRGMKQWEFIQDGDLT